MWATIFALLAFQSLVVQGKEPKLFITHPKTVIKGREFPVDLVFASPAEEPESFTVTFLQTSKTVIRGVGQSLARVNFMVGSDVIDRQGYVVVNYTNTGTQLVRSQISSIRNITSTIIIQTDKGKYKPGQSVLIRVLNVDSDLKPLQNNITIIVKDPADNTVYEKKSTSTASERGGIIEGNCTLIDDAPLGQYKISVYGLTKKEAVFTVEKYTLPKFETIVTLDVTSVAKKPGMTSIPIKGEVKAVYTYGQFVAGNLKLFVNGKMKLEEPKFDGFKRIDISIDDVEYLNSKSTLTLKIQAIVEEGTTGNSANASASLNLLPVPFTAQPVEPISDYSENDPLFTFQVRLVDPVEGSLGWDDNGATADISNYRLFYEYYQDYNPVTFNESMVSNPAVVSIKVDERTALSNNQLKVWFMYDPLKLKSEKVSVEVRKLESYSKDYIMVVLTDSDQDNKACFRIENANSNTYYQIVGNEYQSAMMAYDQNLDEHCFGLTQEHAPLFEVIGYKIHDDGVSEFPEILANRVVGTHSEAVQRQVSMLVNPGTVKPGESVNIEIRTSAPGKSFIGIRAVDKSSLLLQRGHDVSQIKIDSLRMKDRLFNNDVDRDAPDFPVEPMPFGIWRSPYVASISPGSIIQDAGLSLSTSKTLRLYTCSFCDGEITEGERLPNIADAVFDDDEPIRKENDAAVVESGEEEDDTRKDFPETWIWDLREIQFGTTQFQETVPDTITNWVIDVFSLNPTSGLEAIPTQELTVTKPLFISMNLPYSIVRGEQFTLQILVFNYNTEEVNVKVTLKSSTDFMVPVGAKLSDTIIIGAKANGVLEVPIKATTIGEVKLEATAEQVSNSTNSDNVERMLLVEAEGIPTVNFTRLPVESLESQTSQTFSINLMDLVQNKTTFVEGSLRAYVQVTGDVMGSYISGLENLFHMPSGCGEQNIMSMTPGLFVGKYLKALDKLILDVELQVKKACIAGYTQELNYKHSDGSYSAFGERDGPIGSTWLTAYVLKMFSILGEEDFAEGILNPKILAQAFDFIKRSEKESKNFEYFQESGKVIHKEMQQGGRDGNYSFAFSAYITISIQDYHDYLVAKGDTENRMRAVKTLLTGASTWLYQKRGSSLIADLGRPLIAYTLARSGAILNNTQFITAAEALMESFRLISMPVKVQTKRPKSSDVERNGYALLSYVTLYRANTQKKMEFKEEAQRILNWLTSNRGANGFFSSTQDTAVGLQAIAEYAIEFPEQNVINFSVQVSQNNNQMVVDNNNYYVMQQQQVDVSELNSNNLNVQVSGNSGQPLVTVLVHFNTESNVTGTSLNATIEKKISPVTKKPYLRVNINEIIGENRLQPSAMILCKLQVSSPNVVDEIISQGSIKPSRTEISENRKEMVVYIMNDQDQLMKYGFEFDVTYSTIFDIENTQPGKMFVYDYYATDNNLEVLFDSINQAPIEDPEDPTTGAAGLTINLILMSLTCLVIILQKSAF